MVWTSEYSTAHFLRLACYPSYLDITNARHVVEEDEFVVLVILQLVLHLALHLPHHRSQLAALLGVDCPPNLWARLGRREFDAASAAATAAAEER